MFPIFVMHTQLVLILLKTKSQEEWEDNYVFLLLQGHEIYLFDVHVVFYIWKQWKCSGLENSQFGGELGGIFLRENEKKKEINLEETDNRKKLDKESDVPNGE